MFGFKYKKPIKPTAPQALNAKDNYDHETNNC